MKKFLKFAIGALSLGAILLSGCGKNNDEAEKSGTETLKKDYDIFIYNSDTSIGKSFREMCDEYTKRTGVIIRTVTPCEEDSTVENLDSYINSQYPPDIFTVKDCDELKRWQQTDNIWDFNNATEDSFKEVVNNIPTAFRLSSNTTDSFGVPATINGYGLVVDPKMISSLFGGDTYKKVIDDLANCSYEEFSDFVEALDNYINTGSSAEFTLNEKTYSFSESKGELSEKLNSVFAFDAGNDKNIGCYLVNTALASVFSSPAEAFVADDNTINSLGSAIMRYMQMLDLMSSYVSGSNGALYRGTELISSSKNGKSQSIKNFINGKAVFLVAQSKDYDNINIFDSLVAKRCVFIPFKSPIIESDVSFTGKSFNKNINKSLTVDVPIYYCINSRSSEKEKKAAQDFLTWYKTSDLAQKYIVSDFKYVPYDIKTASVIDNPLERSMVEYIEQNRFLPAIFKSTFGTWSADQMGKYIVNNFLNKPTWSMEDYENVADYSINKWKELKNKV